MAERGEVGGAERGEGGRTRKRREERSGEANPRLIILRTRGVDSNIGVSRWCRMDQCFFSFTVIAVWGLQSLIVTGK